MILMLVQMSPCRRAACWDFSASPVRRVSAMGTLSASNTLNVLQGGSAV